MSRPAAQQTVASHTTLNGMDRLYISSAANVSPAMFSMLSDNNNKRNMPRKGHIPNTISGRASQRTEQTLNDCSLAMLPADMRNIVYEMVLGVPGGVPINFDHDHNTGIPHNLFVLSSTCRQIHYECKLIPYPLNTIRFHMPVLEEPTQLAKLTRSHYSSTPIVLPLPQVIQLQRRKRQIANTNGGLASRRRDLRDTLAMRLPHIDGIVPGLERVVTQPIISRLRRVHVHFGSQTRHPFIVRFFSTWGEVVPALVVLGNMRISS